MLITVKTFNGFALNNTDYQAAVLRSKTPPDANLVFLEQAKADALYAGTFNINVRSVPVAVRIIDQANIYALEAELKEALRPGTEGKLVVTFSDDSQDYEMDCVVQSILADERFLNVWTVIFQTGDTCWKTVTENTASWSPAASGETKTITVGGYSETRLSLEMKAATLPSVGWAYQKLYQLVNAVGYDYGLRPWCITLDTATLVTAGKMQADCDDLRVVVDGEIVPRWMADKNTASTKVWINLNLSAGQQLTLLTAVASSGEIDELEFEVSEDNKLAIAAMPERGYVVHGTEWFEYSGKSKKFCKLFITTRGALGTTMQAHSAADVFNWVQHSIFLLYGNSTATDPSVDNAAYDDTKPVFDLSSSSNTSWVYTTSTLFYDPDHPGRTGMWKPTIEKVGKVSKIYYVKADAESGDPAMGMKISTWVKNGNPRSEFATLGWELKHAGKITSISATGQAYRNSSAWPGSTAIQCQKYGVRRWIEIWNSAKPTAEDTWESITKSSYSISPGKEIVRFVFTGSIAAQLDVDTYFEILTATVEFTSANQPTGTLGTEASNLLLDLTITNQNNGDAIGLVFPMQLNKVLDLDGESLEVTYDLVNAHRALSMDDESRDVWVRLVPGSNTLKIVGVGVNTLSITLKWKKRRI